MRIRDKNLQNLLILAEGGIILRPHWAGTPMIMWMFRWAIFVHLCLALITLVRT
jgi:hypothetical protein